VHHENSRVSLTDFRNWSIIAVHLDFYIQVILGNDDPLAALSIHFQTRQLMIVPESLGERFAIILSVFAILKDPTLLFLCLVCMFSAEHNRESRIWGYISLEEH
jgi:hypothetical protein